MNESDEEVTLFVGGLAHNITELDLHQYFSQFATVLSATLVRNKVTGESRGFGFVSINSSLIANKLILQKNVICERRIECQLASGREDKHRYKQNMKLRKIFVSNIPFGVDNEMLEVIFCKFGRIHNSYIIQNTQTNTNQPYGFVEYVNVEDAQKLLALNPVIKLKGVDLKISSYLDRDEQKSMKLLKAAFAYHLAEDGSNNMGEDPGTAITPYDPSNRSPSNKMIHHNRSFYFKYPISAELNESYSNYVFRVDRPQSRERRGYYHRLQ